MSNSRVAGRPRYAVVAQALIEDTLSDRYPLGATLPSEQALCTRYDISGHTARETLRRLRALGLVTRRTGVGTQVKSNHIAQRYMQVGDTVLNVLEVTNLEADADIAALLGCPRRAASANIGDHAGPRRGRKTVRPRGGSRISVLPIVLKNFAH